MCDRFSDSDKNGQICSGWPVPWLTFWSVQRAFCKRSLKSSTPSLWCRTEGDAGRSGLVTSHTESDRKWWGSWKGGTDQFCTTVFKEGKGAAPSSRQSMSSGKPDQHKLRGDLSCFWECNTPNGLTPSITVSQYQADWNSSEPATQPTKWPNYPTSAR